MAIPESSIEKWLLETVGLEDEEQRRIRRNQLERAVEEFSEKGYEIKDIISQGGSGVILKGEVKDPEKIQERYFDELSFGSTEDVGYSMADLIARAIVVSSYFFDKEKKSIVKDPSRGEKFKSVKQAEEVLKKYSRPDLEKILEQLASRSFPRKGQMIAIKLSLNPGDKRFRREKRIAPLNLLKEKGAKNVVAYYEYGLVCDEYRYHVLEYIMNAVPLRELPLLEQKLKGFMVLLSGLKFIHEYGNIVHRDIKPGNFLIRVRPNKDYKDYIEATSNLQAALKERFEVMTRQRQTDRTNYLQIQRLQEKKKRLDELVQELEEKKKELPRKLKVSGGKITDFGLAKFLNKELKPNDIWTYTTEGGTVLGTPFYMAPELAPEGDDSPSHDFRCDIYSAGAVLYEILTEKPPYMDRMDELELRSFTDYLYKVVADRSVKPTHPKRLNKHADPYLIKICAKAIHRDMNMRYKNVWEMASDIERWHEYRKKSALRRFGARLADTILGISPIPGRDLSSQVFR